jgi:hypothetical protein
MNIPRKVTPNEALKIAVKMHKKFNGLNQEFGLDFILCENIWSDHKYDISYNLQNNQTDLFNGDGETYTAKLYRIIYEDSDFLLASVVDDCDTYAMLFLKENQVKIKV